MTDEVVPVTKDEESEGPIPSVWRPTFRAIVDAFLACNFQLNGLAGVESLDEDWAASIADNIRAYGSTLAPLPDQTWDTSVCIWLGTRWGVLVDLFTVEDGRSDLVLDVNVFERDSGYVFKVHLVYVP